ncbi:hypothetical protein AN618_22440 [Fervidicola ferrireducens]|uniref:Uncharacterized protein n=1 Tax=Fervidicola ferrireducens TaxID=520764 RepID=A0A140L222_9FIRM|nr:IS200/IS605 family accessory protein TnpB-related protein [Fervidicola ferrireducens]KXG74597.1 hypothetical protein AN618_22440 [Fervidicola ferrireducens]
MVTKENGIVGIDINAYPNHIAWSGTDENGNLVSYGRVPMPELTSGNSNKREYYRWQSAHEVVRLAEEKEKAIAIEKLDIRGKGKRGDFSGRKSRRIRHGFSYRSLLEKNQGISEEKGYRSHRGQSCLHISDRDAEICTAVYDKQGRGSSVCYSKKRVWVKRANSRRIYGNSKRFRC